MNNITINSNMKCELEYNKVPALGPRNESYFTLKVLAMSDITIFQIVFYADNLMDFYKFLNRIYNYTLNGSDVTSDKVYYFSWNSDKFDRTDSGDGTLNISTLRGNIQINIPISNQGLEQLKKYIQYHLNNNLL